MIFVLLGVCIILCGLYMANQDEINWHAIFIIGCGMIEVLYGVYRIVITFFQILQ